MAHRTVCHHREVPIVQFSIYWVQLKSSEECPPLLRLQWPVYEIRATAREVPSFSTAYTVFSLPNTGYHPEYLLFWYGLCNLQSFEYGYNHLTVGPCVISLPDGRYLSMECFFLSCAKYAVVGLPVVSLMSSLIGPTNALPLHWVCSCQSPGRWPIRWSGIIQRMRFSCTEYAVTIGCAVVNFSVVSLLSALPLSQGCVSPAPTLTPITRPRA